MKKFLLFGWLIACAAMMHAQQLTITDIDTGEPLESVVIMSEKPQAFAITDSRGQADISDFRGAEAILIQMLNYASITTSYAQLQTDGFKVSLTVNGISLGEVVVSATRWNQTSTETPSKVAAISAKQVALQNPQTAADLLGISGKVFIQKSQQGGGSPMIRGFATNRLLYTVDGVRMNTAIFRAGNIQNVISLDPFATERTEVFFGPGSVIYGSDAIGGVMAFQTLTPHYSGDKNQKTSGQVAFRHATANQEMTGHMDVNIGWQKWALVTSITATDYDHLRMGSHGPEEYLRPFYIERIDGTDVVVNNEDPRVQIPSAYSQMNFMQKVRFRAADNLDVQYGFHYSETSPYARYDRHIRYRNGAARYGEWNYGPQIWMMNNLKVSHFNQTKLYNELTVRVAAQRFEESRISRDIDDDNREIRTEKVDAYSVNLDMVKNLGQKNELYYGVEWVLNDVNSTGTNEDISTGDKTEGPSRYPQARWGSYGVYATSRVHLSSPWILQLGARYNQFVMDAAFSTDFYPFPFTNAQLNEGSLTGSAGLIYRPSENWVWSTNVATAFRAPNVDDLGKVFDSEPGAVVVPNPQLNAEYAYNWDLGMAHSFGNKAKIDVSVYYTLLNNAMVRRDFLLNGEDSIMYDGELSKVQAIQNAAKAHVVGLQVGFEALLGAGFKFATDANFQRGREELDDGTVSPSRHAAPWFGITRLTYTHARMTWEVNASYSGEVAANKMPVEEQGKPEIYATDANGKPYSPSWVTLNFKSQFALNQQITISGGMENLTDRRYRPYSSGIVAPGRNFVLSVRGKF